MPDKIEAKNIMMTKGFEGQNLVVPGEMYQQGLIQSRALLQGLARALYRKERLSVLKLALIAFDHDIIPLYDKLCHAGAMTVLVRCLQSAMSSATFHSVEINQMCELITLLFRCSNDAAVFCMKTIGAELVMLLFSILLKTGIGRDSYSPIRMLIRRIASIEVSFPTIDESSRLLAYLEQMALVDTSEDNKAVSVEALTLLVGLTMHPESKLYVMESPTFLGSVIKCGQQNTPGAEARDQVARVLQNLTLHENNKPKMTKQLIVEQLVAMISPFESNITRIHSIQALKQISVDVKGKLFIVAFEGGNVLSTLLSAAVDDRSLQPVVVETLLSLTCKSTAASMVNHPGLVATIACCARSGNALVAEKAAQSIKRLSTHICMNQKGHQALFDAILSVADSKSFRVRHWMAKSMLDQSRLSGSSFLLVRSPEALLRICELARDRHNEVQGPAVETLLSLSGYYSNLKRLSMSSNVLDTLVQTVETGLREGEEARRAHVRDAILCTLNFIAHRSSRKRAAKHVGLVACLSKYGISDDEDDELKKTALHGVIVYSSLI